MIFLLFDDHFSFATTILWSDAGSGETGDTRGKARCGDLKNQVLKCTWAMTKYLC